MSLWLRKRRMVKKIVIIGAICNVRRYQFGGLRAVKCQGWQLFHWCRRFNLNFVCCDCDILLLSRWLIARGILVAYSSHSLKFWRFWVALLRNSNKKNDGWLSIQFARNEIVWFSTKYKWSAIELEKLTYVVMYVRCIWPSHNKLQLNETIIKVL